MTSGRIGLCIGFLQTKQDKGKKDKNYFHGSLGFVIRKKAKNIQTRKDSSY
jgi:hypothetical protein